jgi:hypothetical protein
MKQEFTLSITGFVGMRVEKLQTGIPKCAAVAAAGVSCLLESMAMIVDDSHVAKRIICGCRGITVGACVLALLSAAAALCVRSSGKKAAGSGLPRHAIGAEPSQLPSQRDVSLWCQSIMRAVRKLSNQTVHLKGAPEVHGLSVVHEEQRRDDLPFKIAPSRGLLQIGQDAENQRLSGTEGETCLRCAARVLFRCGCSGFVVLPHHQAKPSL